MRHSSVQYGKNSVKKTADPDLMRVEVEKAGRAFEIGKACGLFRVPEVLDYDDAKGVAVFELIRGIRPFIHNIDRSRTFADRLGRSLAIVHRELSLPPGMALPLPEEFDLAGTEVFFHGDFNGKNVCLQPGSDSIVILDWQMTWHHGGRATYGSRFFDLIWFIDYLLWSQKFNYLFRDPIVPVLRTFLQSYFREAGVSYDPGVFGPYAARFFERDLPQRKKRVNSLHRYLLFRRSQALKGKLLDSLGELEI